MSNARQGFSRRSRLNLRSVKCWLHTGMESAPESKLSDVVLVNPYIHESAKLTRAEFLHRVRRVKAIRTEEWLDRSHDRPLLTAFPSALNQWLMIERFHTLVNKGRFDFLDEELGRHFFVVVIPPRLFAWFRNVELSVLQKQIINWLAGVSIVQPSKKEEWFGRLYGPVRDEAQQLVEQHYASRLDIGHLYDGDGTEYLKRVQKVQDLYVEVSKKLTGASPPSIFQLFEHERSPVKHPYWGLNTDYSFQLSGSYFTKADWDGVVNKEGDDQLLRSESSPEAWEKWLHTFVTFPERRSFVWSLRARDGGTGFVYLIRDSMTGLHKIGFTAEPDLPKRLAGLQTGSPGQLIEVGMFPVSGKKTEDVIHDSFHEKRVRGEWFCLSEQDIRDLLDEQWRLNRNIF